jgi:hypothetical protein
VFFEEYSQHEYPGIASSLQALLAFLTTHTTTCIAFNDSKVESLIFLNQNNSLLVSVLARAARYQKSLAAGDGRGERPCQSHSFCSLAHRLLLLAQLSD